MKTTTKNCNRLNSSFFYGFLSPYRRVTWWCTIAVERGVDQGIPRTCRRRFPGKISRAKENQQLRLEYLTESSILCCDDSRGLLAEYNYNRISDRSTSLWSISRSGANGFSMHQQQRIKHTVMMNFVMVFHKRF